MKSRVLKITASLFVMATIGSGSVQAQFRTASASGSANSAQDAGSVTSGGTCFSEAVDYQNVDQHLRGIDEALSDATFWSLIGNLLAIRQNTALDAVMDGNVEMLVGAQETLAAFQSGQISIDGEVCFKPAYSCTGYDGLPKRPNSRFQCSRCAQTTPPGVPPGGAGSTSCRLCAAHFGSTPEQARCSHDETW